MKKFILVLIVIFTVFSLTSCAMLGSEVNELNGAITGNTYECSFYSNEGQKFMTMEGKKIDMSSNVVLESTYVDGSWGYTKTLSSVMTITIDGKQVENCGSTVIFAEKGLTPDVDYHEVELIESNANGFSSNTFIANIVNRYKNMNGKPMVVVIQSQLGDPICSFSGDKVYWEVCQDLPKTTKLMIDRKALYIHRANFQIIDKSLLN